MRAAVIRVTLANCQPSSGLVAGVNPIAKREHKNGHELCRWNGQQFNWHRLISPIALIPRDRAHRGEKMDAIANPDCVQIPLAHHA
jgi:hypothetical protein